MKICPECGSNVLKRHQWFHDIETWKWIDTGIWHTYDKIELGVYTCECGHVFSITEDNFKDFEDGIR